MTSRAAALPPELTRQGAGRLYLALGRITRVLRREASSPIGHGALSALVTLSQQGPMRLGELAAQEGVAAPSMTRIVASLEQAALVRRTQDPADGRAYLVQATADGEGLVLAGRAARMVALRTRLEGLPPDQQAAVLAALPALEALSSDD